MVLADRLVASDIGVVAHAEGYYRRGMRVRPMADVTAIIDAIKSGDRHVPAHRLLLLYDELRGLAAHRLPQESPRQTLQPTALVHEESSTGGPAS